MMNQQSQHQPGSVQRWLMKFMGSAARYPSYGLQKGRLAENGTHGFYRPALWRIGNGSQARSAMIQLSACYKKSDGFRFAPPILRLLRLLRLLYRSVAVVFICMCFAGTSEASQTSSLSRNEIFKMESERLFIAQIVHIQSSNAMNKQDAFAITYLYSINFDTCNEQKLGELFRRVLTNYYDVCVKTNDNDDDIFDQAKSRVTTLDKEIKDRNLSAVDGFLQNMDWVWTCPVFNRKNSTTNVIKSLKEHSGPAAKWNVPEDCGNQYDWLFQ